MVPIAAAAFLGLLWSLRRRDRLSLPRAAVAAALCVYLAGIVANTVFPIYLDKPTGTGPWSDLLNLVPVVGYEPADFAMNVAVFVPLGVLVALVVTRPSWVRVLVVSAAVSATIEVTQFVTGGTLGGGHVADVNDLLSNAVGGLLGFGLLALLDRVPAVRAVVDRFRWQEGPPAR
ncbi:VanZ family protein [Kineococcus sp. TBRC 1896]|uniref:VanZ family protein n=1 Tax=Kineococcus mangrovi TaxID=1660183 RepID=A0ABV4I221_9ACTN